MEDLRMAEHAFFKVCYSEDYISNPLEDMDIEILKNISMSDIKDKDIVTYTYKNVYVYDHSGKSFRFSPFSCHWDSCFYGVMIIPNDFFGTNCSEEKKEEIMESLLQEYENWAEGNIFNVFFTNKNVPGELDMAFNISGFEPDSENIIFSEYNIVGIENVEYILKMYSTVVTEYNNYKSSPWARNNIDSLENLLLDNSIDTTLDIIKNASIEAYHIEEFECGMQ